MRIKAADNSVAPPAAAAVGLRACLEGRRPELEESMIARVQAISDPAEIADPIYVGSLRAAIGAEIDYVLGAIGGSRWNPPPLPPSLLVQARLAAHRDVGLDTVLRRHIVGFAVIGDFLVEEVERARVPLDEMRRVLRLQAIACDRLLAAVGEEHARARESSSEPTEQRSAELSRRLLAGERVDSSELGYDLDAWHVAVLTNRAGASGFLNDLARSLDRQLLSIRRGDGLLLAWLGGRRRIDAARIQTSIQSTSPADVSFAVGEPGRGVSGWRLSHRQALAALPIALRRPGGCTRYAEVALMASVLQDDLLAASLRQLYLAPLEAEREGGAVLLETLRTYFVCGRNSSSTAAALGVTRQTVNNRLRSIEEKIEHPLPLRIGELEAAVCLDELEDHGFPNA